MSLRRATADDAAELTRLRTLMYDAWGADTSDPHWRAASDGVFRTRLSSPDDFAAYVVESEGRLVASGAAWIEQHLSSPTNPSGRRGHIASMSTDPAHRGRGHARAIFAALLAWFDDRGVTRIDLTATAMGESLYLSHGFREPGGRFLTIDRAGPLMDWGTGRSADC